MKSEIFNLIILDESGSMISVKPQTISGCNETINTIRTAQKNFEETQRHFVSIFAFQSDGSQLSRYLIKNAPIGEVAHITEHQYDPWGSTPLYDAVGSTLTDLKATLKDKKFAVGSVTIITDGMENTSQHYTLGQVARMIESLKELGWNFNFIGANIDVKATAESLCIDNHLEFEQTVQGTAEMFAKENDCRLDWLKKSHDMIKESACLCSEDDSLFRNYMKNNSKGYFKK